MNINKLFECLTINEKKQLLKLLQGAPFLEDEILVTDFIKIVDPTLRLYNAILLRRAFDGMALSDVSKSYFLKQLNCGMKTWNEFELLRYEYLNPQP